MITRRIIVALLFLSAAVYGVLGWRELSVSSSTAKPGDLGAPVISARRVPLVAQAAAEDQATRGKVLQLLDEAGGNSCIEVRRNGVIVAERRSDSQLIPASTMKLLTGSAALEALGANTKFETTVKAASVKSGVVAGPLYLVGGGDPLLFTSDYQRSLKDQIDKHTPLETLADEVVKAGVKIVRGGISADDRYFDGQRLVPSWDRGYVDQAQVGSIGALTVNQGIELRPGRTVVADPATHAANVFTDLLRARGVEIAAGPGLGAVPSGADEVAKIESRPLPEIVEQMLTESDNTTAEILLKQVGKEKKNSGSTTAGAEAVIDTLDLDDSKLVDGSGLDRGDRTTCGTVAGLLAAAGDKGVLSTGLARAGESGTLLDRMKNTPAVGRVQAKTGTLSNVSALSGWARPDGTSPMAFSMIVNGTNENVSERIEDRLAVLLAGVPPLASSDAYAPDRIG